ncbi:uncharacterized protein AKAME5_002034700 [Lates japonicus]|uniref:Fibronectin type-III domain-containing protein n=1 Tax=Lates japonicus TaxID=270547 RepID=A0AAD3ND35_LATJO|nr:uncharacterized protein AKAME5_002034700 [Lates japonicus]
MREAAGLWRQRWRVESENKVKDDQSRFRTFIIRLSNLCTDCWSLELRPVCSMWRNSSSDKQRGHEEAPPPQCKLSSRRKHWSPSGLLVYTRGGVPWSGGTAASAEHTHLLTLNFIDTMASCGEDTIETAAVGRPFQLGMLYDCRKDALIPGVTLWDLKELQKNTSVQQQNNTEFNVTASDSIEEKSNLLKISGSLKLSLLGGLVNVRGSAKYFQDTKKSQKQARVTLQYNATTKFETLTMSHLAHGQVSHPNVFEDDTATHVVTAILYGAGAYFVFDRESSSEDETKQVEGEANLTFNKLKFLTVDAEASLNMDDKERAALENFSCMFHGDFKLPSNPTSFTDAVRVYRTLPNLLGQDGEHAVPLRVWLYPLVKLDSRAARLQRDISRALITCSSETIESLNRTEMRCSDLLKDTAATTFPAMEKKVQDLMQMCRQYKLDFMQKLGSVLPSIRGGGKEESVLEEILKAHERSPFNNKDLDQWLRTKGKESDTLKSFLKQLDKLGVKMDDHLDDLLSDLDVRNVVCFSFTSVDQPDAFLVKLSNHLRPAGMVDSAGSSDLQDTNTDWLSSDTRQTMRKQLKLFGELKKSCNSDDTKFIVTSKYAESHPGACIFIYEDGCDDAVCFVSPSKPATPSTTASYDSFTVTVSEPDSATVEYTVDYREKQQQDTEWTSHPVKKNQETVTLSGLKPDTEYEIRATTVGKLSYAVSSDVCRAVTLTAVGPPTQVKDTEVKANTITLTWSNPSVQRCESVKQFIIEFREENSSQWQSKETREEVYTFTLNSLKQDTVYSIRMCTDGGVGVSQPGEELKIKTKKEPLDTKKFTVLQVNNMDTQIAETTQSLITAAEMRETTKMLMQPNANWEEYLTPVPLSIAIMGELVFISSCDDFSINKNPPKDGFRFIKYPDSFRACLMQIYDSLSHTFNEAHKNMDQICSHTSTVPDYMKAAVDILFNSTDEVIETLLPNQLENICTAADECEILADSVEKYTDVNNLIQELLEACINAEYCYGEELEKVKMKLEETKLREQSARQSYEKCVEKNQKELTDVLFCQIKMLVKGLDAMGRVKEQWEKMVLFFKMVSNIIKTSLSKTMHNFVETSDATKKLSYNRKLFAKDQLYNQAFQASNASLVHMISETYTQVSK